MSPEHDIVWIPLHYFGVILLVPIQLLALRLIGGFTSEHKQCIHDSIRPNNYSNSGIISFQPSGNSAMYVLKL
jgi:hypothetical protein